MAKIIKSKPRRDLAGTSRVDRVSTPILPETIKQDEVILPEGYPDPPDTLDEEGKKVYWELSWHCAKVKALWVIDHYMIAQAAKWITIYNKTILEYNGNYIQTYASGVQQVSAQLRILNNAEEHILKYFDRLGIGAKSRESIGLFNTTGGSETADPFTLLAKRIETIYIRGGQDEEE